MNLTFLSSLRSFLTSAATLCCLALTATGTTYYISSSTGNDRNQGVSAAAPRRTLGSVNSLAPGDTVLLRRGDRWAEQLTLQSGGDSGHPVTVAAFGLGPRPVISGADFLTGWSASGRLSYSAVRTMMPQNVYVDGQAITHSASVQDVDNTAGSWFYDSSSKRIYVHTRSSDSPALHRTEVPARRYGVYASGVGYVKVSNLEVRETLLSGILVENSGAEYWTISDNFVHNTGESGIAVRPGYTPSSPLRGWTIRNNVVGTIDNPPALDYDRAGILVRGTLGAVIDGNQVATINKIGIRVSDFFGLAISAEPIVSGNVLGLNQGNISIAFTDRALVTRNVIRNSKGYGVGIGKSSDAEVSFNTIQNLTISDDHSLYNGIDINVGSLRGTVHHNVVVGVTFYSLTLEDSGGQPSDDWVIRNNIFDARTNLNPVSPGDVVGTIMIMPAVTRYTFSSNNYVPHPSHVGQLMRLRWTDLSFASWLNSTGDTGSISTDPLFNNPGAGDFALDPLSPCAGLKDDVQSSSTTDAPLIECGLLR